MIKVYRSLLCLIISVLCVAIWEKAEAVTTQIIVGVNANAAPYTFVDESGELAGMCIDVFNGMADGSKFQATYVAYENDLAAYVALSDGDIDVFLGAKHSVLAGYDFENIGEITSSSLCMISSNEIAESINLQGKPYYHYCLVTDVITQLMLSSANLDQSQFGLTMRRITANQKETLNVLMDGDAQFAVIDKQGILYELEKTYDSENYTILNNYLSSVKYTAVIRKEDRALQRELEIALADFKITTAYQDAVEKWTQDSATDIYDAYMMRKILRWGSVILGVVLAIIIINMYINAMLKKRVNEKTAELRTVNNELVQQIDRVEREQRFRNELIDNSVRGMVIFDEKYRILYINQVAEAMDEYVSTAAVNEDIRVHSVFGRILKNINYNVFCESEDENKIPMMITLAGQSGEREYRYATYITPTTLKTGEEKNVLMVVEDVTWEEKRRRAKQEEEKHKALNMMVAGIAHEIKNPLMSIQTYTSILPEQVEDREFLSSFSMHIPREVNRINRLVEALVDYARPVRGNMDNINLVTAVKESLYLAEAYIARKNIRIVTELKENAIIIANRDKTNQAIFNILINGLESMSQKALEHPERDLHMRVFTTRCGNSISLHVLDEGEGMTPAEIRQCTDPFYTTKSTGTGMGMTLVQQFVKDNNGSMEIKSVKGEYTEIVLMFEEAGNIDE